MIDSFFTALLAATLADLAIVSISVELVGRTQLVIKHVRDGLGDTESALALLMGRTTLMSLPVMRFSPGPVAGDQNHDKVRASDRKFRLRGESPMTGRWCY